MGQWREALKKAHADVHMEMTARIHNEGGVGFVSRCDHPNERVGSLINNKEKQTNLKAGVEWHGIRKRAKGPCTAVSELLLHRCYKSARGVARVKNKTREKGERNR